MARALLEICVDAPDGLSAAFRAGADRVELCGALAVGGITPGPGLIACACDRDRPVTIPGTSTLDRPVTLAGTADLDRPVTLAGTSMLDRPVTLGGTGDRDRPVTHAGAGDRDRPVTIPGTADLDRPVTIMVRPRPGDFVYDAVDLHACLQDIAAARAAGLAGVAIGAARSDGTLDEAALAAMVAAAGPMAVTLHRVVDTLADPMGAVDVACRLGVTRILTSGGAADAGAGLATIARMVRAARGRVEIMAGGGVTPGNARALLDAGVDALHASCTVDMPGSGALPSPQLSRRRTDAAAIAALRAAMHRTSVAA